MSELEKFKGEIMEQIEKINDYTDLIIVYNFVEHILELSK